MLERLQQQLAFTNELEKLKATHRKSDLGCLSF